MITSNKGGMYSLFVSGLITGIGAYLLNKQDKKNEARLQEQRRNSGKKTIQQIDDLTALMNYLNQRLIQNKIDGRTYTLIGQQACKEYQQLEGHLNFPQGIEAYVNNKIEFIAGMKSLQNSYKK